MDNPEQVRAVQLMQDYIETHLNEPITLHLLAEAAGYSPWHCARLFKELTGKTPFEYIRMYRLSRAAMELRDGGAHVVDVAVDFMFDSHEGFTRAFRKQFGLSPSAYRQSTPPLNLFHPWSIQDTYTYLHGGPEAQSPLSQAFSVQVRSFPPRKLLLRRGVEADDYFSYCGEVGCEIWGLLCSVREALYEPIGLWLPDSLRPANTSRYAQGVELSVHYRGVVPEGFDLIDLPACEMMLFQGMPYDESRFQEAVSGLSEAIDRFDPGSCGYRWAEDMAPRIQLEPQGWRGYIEGRCVREL